MSRFMDRLMTPYKRWKLEQDKLRWLITASPDEIARGNTKLGVPPRPRPGSRPKPQVVVAAHTKSNGQKVKKHKRNRRVK